MTRFDKLFSAVLFSIAMMTVCALAILALNVTRALAEPGMFINKALDNDAKRYETYLHSHWKPGRLDVEQLLQSGRRILNADPRAASRDFARAAVAKMHRRGDSINVSGSTP